MVEGLQRYSSIVAAQLTVLVLELFFGVLAIVVVVLIIVFGEVGLVGAAAIAACWYETRHNTRGVQDTSRNQRPHKACVLVRTLEKGRRRWRGGGINQTRQLP